MSHVNDLSRCFGKKCISFLKTCDITQKYMCDLPRQRRPQLPYIFMGTSQNVTYTNKNPCELPKFVVHIFIIYFYVIYIYIVFMTGGKIIVANKSLILLFINNNHYLRIFILFIIYFRNIKFLPFFTKLKVFEITVLPFQYTNISVFKYCSFRCHLI